jgi:hypothetical protein
MRAVSLHPEPVVVRHRLLTVEDYHKMAEAGILGEDDRVELIDGELIEMAPIGSNHAGEVRIPANPPARKKPTDCLLSAPRCFHSDR